MDEQAAKLLVKAVRMLPQREQDRVLMGVLRTALAEPRVFGGPVPSTPSLVVGPELHAPAMGAAGQSTMLPVRLTPEVHERLRRWSTQHGFSMAGVVRGLVERFLDEQAGTRAARGTGAAKATRTRPSTAKPKARRATARG